MLIPKELSVFRDGEDDPVTGWDDRPEILPSTTDRKRARPLRVTRRVSVMAVPEHLPVGLYRVDDALPA